jgi:hypothetical protein
MNAHSFNILDPELQLIRNWFQYHISPKCLEVKP